MTTVAREHSRFTKCKKCILFLSLCFFFHCYNRNFLGTFALTSVFDINYKVPCFWIPQCLVIISQKILSLSGFICNINWHVHMTLSNNIILILSFNCAWRLQWGMYTFTEFKGSNLVYKIFWCWGLGCFIQEPQNETCTWTQIKKPTTISLYVKNNIPTIIS